MNEQERILNHCKEKFFKEGFHKTTMDEIAAGLSISKKTIYKHFNSKDEIVSKIIDSIINYMDSNVSGILDRNTNAVQKLYEISKLITNLSVQFDERWFKDLQAYGANHWQRIERFREKKINHNFRRIFRQGKEEGLIIDEPEEIMMTILLSSIQATVEPNFIMRNNFSVNQAIESTLGIIFSAFLSTKGKRTFQKYKSGKQK
jgi:AcrR family transcriptional regulator